MEAAQGKEWAVGMSQDDFIPEFKRRHPKSDFIPNVNKWTFVPYSDKPRIRPLPNTLKVLPPEPKMPAKEEILVCKGCNKEFKGKPRFAHLATHKKRCKDYLNMRRE